MLVFIVLFCVLFRSALAELITAWFGIHSYYSQGPFVVIVFFWLIKKRCNAGPELLSASYLPGSLVLLFSLLAELGAGAIQSNTLHFIAIYLFAAANVLFFLGKKFFFRNIPLVLYLLLAVPLPTFVLDMLTFKLKLFASWISGNILGLIYPATILYGNVLHINNYNIEITPACSGLENILGMLSLVCLLALLQTKRKIIILDCLIVLPAAVASNILRILVVSVLTVSGYGALALGTFHTAIGVISFILIFLPILLFNDLPRAKSEGDAKVSLFSRVTGGRYLAPYLAVMALAALAITLFGVFTRQDASGAVPVRDTVPRETCGWTSVDEKLPESYFRILETDDVLMRAFTKAGGAGSEKIVYFYLAHSSGNRSAYAHRPDLCLAGEGYNLLEHSEISPAAGIRAHRMLFSRSGRGLLVYYWYRFNGENISDYFSLQLRYFNPFNTQKSGSLIRLSRIVDLNNPKDGDDVLLEFMREAMPQIMEKL